MENQFWLERWEDGLIGWHNEDFNQRLVQYGETVFIDKTKPILVPLCGKSLDMLWLLSKGYQVIGCELSHLAIEQFFTENKIPYTLEEIENFKVYKSDLKKYPITVYNGDIFELNRTNLGPLSGTFDRAAYIALNPKQRQEYSKLLHELNDKAPILMETIEYNQAQVDGPPYSISEAEINNSFENNEKILEGLPRNHEE